MVLGNLIFQTEVVEQRFTAVVLPHHDQQASDDRNQTEHGRMLSSNMLLRNLILLIDVTFSTPTPVLNSYTKECFLAKLLRGENSNGCGLIRSVRDVLCCAGECPYLPSRRRREGSPTDFDSGTTTCKRR